ncbi:interleukin-10 receptor subunit alpha [Siniperca chuatsi]|uniref:interleukin-10 receptor subunit alpha n=1 Tax=Siniperca chuatsi TaxID=119488 RepID=UPI001CE06F02|nr:interleukin-10 receptor subunit alpha [Siniperca chuatsi]QIB98878.1 interleukin 10 receptor 1 [Siniperca chuatsi]
MMRPLQTPEVDMSNKTPILVFLIIYINCVSVKGLGIPQLDKLVVKILDGEVIVLWKHPVDAPSNSQYNVQMAKYTGEWATVASCTGITKTYCDLSSYIHDYHAGYKVRVQMVVGDDVSEWTAKKFLPNTSELQPPSFTLWATSSTLTVYVHQKPILRKLFPYGLTYTIYLEERGQETKNTTAYLKDDVGDHQRTKTFSSLHWGREHCVSIKVEGNGALSKSSVSHKQCLVLPEQEWFIIAVSSLSILGVLAFVAIMATTFLCYLRRPEKTPAALKSPVSGWLPLSVGEGTMEVVTDKGWFLSSYRTEVKNCVKDPVTHVTVTEGNEEDRRTSMDSGVSMESNSATNIGGRPPMRQEDSGCGSLGGPESSTSSQTDYPRQDGRTDTDIARKREDSGVGLGCQLDSSSMNLDGQDIGSLKEAVAGGNYRSQSPSAVQVHVCDDEEMFKQMLPGSILAEVVTGYRAGPQSCICSGAGQCTWCHKQDHYGTEVIKQYKAMCIDNGLLSGKCDFVNSYKRGFAFSSYSKKTQMDTVTMDDLETTFIQLGETFPLLTALSQVPLVEGGQDFNMNDVSLSLCDVQLKTD